MNQRLKIYINGIVQGIGFRPFIYNLAKKKNLKGYICNTEKGVEIDVEGRGIDDFMEEIRENPPPLAKITSIKTKKLKANGYKDFEINESKLESLPTTIISPDISICDDCVRELYDENDPRYLHPFINCTNCGPRYTILEKIPYDRKNTSMKKFPMCEFCKTEYTDVTNRRFHAQPVCCPNCGPKLELFNKKKQKMSGDTIDNVVDLLKKGKIIAIKGIGGFHLACDATNDQAVRTLRKRKHRDEKPFAIMAFSVEEIKKYAEVSEKEKQVLEDRTKPIVLLNKIPPNPPLLKGGNRLSNYISINNNYLGVMLPYTPIHYLLFKKDLDSKANFAALIMTSANISNEPICIKNDEAFDRLKNIADYFLIHDREIITSNDDSIVSVINNNVVPVRRSRGFSPQPIILNKKLKPILAVGGELKNTVCLTKDNFAIVSQYIGDLENVAANNNLEKTISHLKNIYKIEPEIIAHDLHPNYFSTEYAKQFSLTCHSDRMSSGERAEESLAKFRGIPRLPQRLRVGVARDDMRIGIQHHHAHIASLMAENNLNEKVIGIALDGTGYGLDGKIWGGEIFSGDLKEFRREFHLEYMPLPGGDSAVKEPWKIGAAYLYKTFGNKIFDIDIDFIRKYKRKIKIIAQMIDKNINVIETSSMGRLFDCISSLSGITERTSYEGQAAMELESFAISKTKSFYEFRINDKEINVKEIIKQIIRDTLQKKTKYEISTKFHNTICEILLKAAIILRKKYRINKVLLSGGCFQNRYLTENVVEKLKKDKFDVYTHKLVPPNDGGIALGQMLIAGVMKMTKEK